LGGGDAEREREPAQNPFSSSGSSLVPLSDRPVSPFVVEGEVGVVSVVCVPLEVVVGSVGVPSVGGVVGASAVVPGIVSVRVGRVGKVTSGRVPVGRSVTPDRLGRPFESPPPQPPRR
jgi:hypothetical protein